MTSGEIAATPAEDLLRKAEQGILLYGLTPPRLTTTPERADEIAQATLARLEAVGPDALILYDVDSESDRATDPRPFPYMPMMDPADFSDRHLAGWHGPTVLYRAVGKHSAEDLTRWFASLDASRVLPVLVGAASRHQAVTTRLTDAYRLYAELDRQPGFGGVCIAERHAGGNDEHRRMISKQAQGCAFFVSQVCYDLDHIRDLLSDYAHTCRDEGVTPRPTILTLAPCGSTQTLEFMSWLGIHVPRWLRTEITRSEDPLQDSYDQCVASARALIGFCRKLGLPFGINVESLTNRKVEIEASVSLAREVATLIRA